MSPHLALAIGELCKAAEDDVDVVTHLFDRYPRSAKDLDWIPDLALTGSWVVVSIDRFKKQHNAEREALRKGGHLVFVLEKEWSGRPFWEKAEHLIGWWPQIMKAARLQSSGMLSVPFSRRTGAKFKQLSL
ncbi:hypothetical protein SRS16CHR_03835 [Variovorax sp. SRS16]|nr:hypothetical protein SRS16CHR_03835 [Variovorax sp. SRS16]